MSSNTIVAIDFGTSNTIVAVQTETSITLWDFDTLTRTFAQVPVVPSLGYIQPRHQGWLWGEQVRQLDLSLHKTNRYWHSFKREMVAQVRSPDRRIDGEVIDSCTVAEKFLLTLLEKLIKDGISIDHLVFSAPVGAFSGYRQWFYQFSQHLSQNLALEPTVHLVDESTSAALGYATTQPQTLVMVIDFGGGTLDISIITTIEIIAEKQALQAEVLAKADAFIGGVDVDEWIAHHWLSRQRIDRTNLTEAEWLQLLAQAEQTKITLSTVPQVQGTDNFGYNLDCSLDRAELTAILENHLFLEQVRQTLDEALEHALIKGIPKSAIQQVLLVGGSCLLSPVQNLVCAYFGQTKVQLDRPFTAVALGALTVVSQAWVADYLHHSYGIRLWEPFSKNYQFYPLFAKGCKYPARTSEPLILQAAIADQTTIHLEIGELMETRELTYDRTGKMTTAQLLNQRDFRSLTPEYQATTRLDLDPPAQIGIDRLALEFYIDGDCNLYLTVKDLLTQQILVDNQSIGAQLR